MITHTTTWGHIALESPATSAMEQAEEESEMAMLRCRYGKKAYTRSLLGGRMPETGAVIFNPNTLQDLADMFETRVELAFG